MNKHPTKSRVFELDILRFLAAFAVIIYHLTYRKIDDQYLFENFGDIACFGYLGVNLFFMISGFVILWSAIGRTPAQFVISRFSRLYPIFWVSIGITVLGMFLFQGQTVELSRIFANMTMAAGYLGVDYIDDVYWTLQVELKFYFLVFVLILLKQTDNIDFWLVAWLSGCVAAIFLPGLSMLVIYPYGPYFIAGATLYLIWQDKITWLRGSVILVCLLLSLVQAVNAVPKFIISPTQTSTIVAPIVVTACYLVMLAISLGYLRTVERQFLIKLAMMTYPLYLLHSKLGRMIFDSLGTNKYISLIITLCLLFILCYVLAVYVDKPLHRQSNKKLNELLSKFGLTRSTQ